MSRRLGAGRAGVGNGRSGQVWRLPVCAALAAAPALLAARVAQAQVAPAAVAPEERFARRGIEAEVLLGGADFEDATSGAFSSHGADTRAEFAAGPAVQMLWGYRVGRWLSVGAHAGYSYHGPARIPERATSAYSYTLAAGAYARFYAGALLGLRRIEPSVTIGFDPVAGLWQQYQVGDLSVQTNVAALALPLTLGFEVYLAPSFALGVALQGSFWFPLSRCVTQQETGIFACPQERGVPDTYLFGGLSGRFAIGL